MPASPTATPEHIKDVNTRYHDAAAHEYDAKWGIDFGDTGQEQVRLKLVKALGGRNGESFGDALEIGSGTGYFSLNLVQLGVIERLTATDISPGMLKQLSATADALGVSGVTTVATEAETLPFEDESFDLVLGHAVLHHIPDLDRAFAEFRRVLRPGRHDRLRRRALALRRPPGGAAEAGRDAGRPRLAASDRRHRRAPSPRPTSPTATRSRARSTSTPSPPPTCASCCATVASRTATSAARSCSPTPGAGACARSSRPPSRTRSPGAGATSPSAATSPCRRWTRGCSSPTCRRSSSTTCSSPPASPLSSPRAGGQSAPGRSLRPRR